VLRASAIGSLASGLQGLVGWETSTSSGEADSTS
jgi:hypothetical protein